MVGRSSNGEVMEKKHKKKSPPPLAGKHWAGTSPVAAVKPGPILQNSARWPLPVQQGKQPKSASGTKKAKGPNSPSIVVVLWSAYQQNQAIVGHALAILMIAVILFLTALIHGHTSRLETIESVQQQNTGKLDNLSQGEANISHRVNATPAPGLPSAK